MHNIERGTLFLFFTSSQISLKIIIIIKVFTKCKIMSVETILHTHTHTHRGTCTQSLIYTNSNSPVYLLVSISVDTTFIAIFS